MIQAINGMGTKSEFAIDNFSLSPQCFGLGVPQDMLEGWHANMTDLELCKYYGESVAHVFSYVVFYFLSFCYKLFLLLYMESNQEQQLLTLQNIYGFSFSCNCRWYKLRTAQAST